MYCGTWTHRTRYETFIFSRRWCNSVGISLPRVTSFKHSPFRFSASVTLLQSFCNFCKRLFWQFFDNQNLPEFPSPTWMSTFHEFLITIANKTPDKRIMTWILRFDIWNREITTTSVLSQINCHEWPVGHEWSINCDNTWVEVYLSILKNLVMITIQWHNSADATLLRWEHISIVLLCHCCHRGLSSSFWTCLLHSAHACESSCVYFFWGLC